MKPYRFIPLVAAGFVFVTGCAHHEGAYTPINQPGTDLENREQFVLLDRATRDSVTCSNLTSRRLEDDRLEVMANVRNRLNRRIEVQLNCVFKDERGFVVNDDAPFQTLILTENAQEGVRFVSANGQAMTFTIRVRQAR